MKWKTDQELFEDIDKNERLIHTASTQPNQDGDANSRIRMSRTFTWASSGGRRFSELENQDANAFREIVGEIEQYVKTHSYIGKFPTNKVNITLAVKEGHYSKPSSSKKKSNTDVELEAALRNVENIREAGISSLHNLTIDAPELSGVANYRVDQIDREAEYTRGRLIREAEELREREEDDDYDEEDSFGAAGEYYTSTLRQKKNSYNFFDKIASWWYGSTKITSVPYDGDLNKSIAIDYIVRALLWAVFACVLLFAANLVWKWDNPVSQMIESQISGTTLLVILFTAASILLLYLTFSSVSEIEIFGIPVPKTAFAYPLIFGTIIGVGSVLELKTGDISETILTIVLWGTIILFFINIWVRSDFLSNWWEAIKAIAVIFFYNACCSAILVGCFEAPDKQVIEIAGVDSVNLDAAHCVFGVIVIVGALGILSNLIKAVSFSVAPKGQNNKKLLKAVQENALTEYKMLRFVWLWINNSNVENKEIYLRAVKKEEYRLKALVKEAQSYAKSQKLDFKLKN